MKIYLTFDYELFFGKSGTAEKSILEPTRRLTQLCERHGAKCVFFVDAGYLDKLKTYSPKFPKLEEERQRVIEQIRQLVQTGHDIQLHVHPHWEQTVYDGNNWVFDLSHYRLDTFSDDAALSIFKRYNDCLQEAAGKPASAFRAGGWCIQPFQKFRPAFERCNIRLDSTVFSRGRNTTSSEWYDFSEAPDLDSWRFDTDPCRVEPNGKFIEVPIASYCVPPTFFWKLAVTKLLRIGSHRGFGDGRPSKNSAGQLTRLLTTFSNSVVSVDGYKSSFLKTAYKKMKKLKRDNFVVIGHPKALSEYSLGKLDQFLGKLDAGDEVTTFSAAF